MNQFIISSSAGEVLDLDAEEGESEDDDDDVPLSKLRRIEDSRYDEDDEPLVNLIATLRSEGDEPLVNATGSVIDNTDVTEEHGGVPEIEVYGENNHVIEVEVTVSTITSNSGLDDDGAGDGSRSAASDDLNVPNDGSGDGSAQLPRVEGGMRQVGCLAPRMRPEIYVVDGEPREGDLITRNRLPARRKVVKERRNQGLSYSTEKTHREIVARAVKDRCQSRYCDLKGKRCSQVSEDRRREIFANYWGMKNLTRQRQWIAKHTARQPCANATEGSRKSFTTGYFLPSDDGSLLPVCMQMFLNTIDVTEKTVRTTMKKLDSTNVLEPELRGGRVASLKERDDQLRQDINEHINRFPRMEAHYVRKNSKVEYLHPDLYIGKMFDMFLSEFPNYKSVRSTYYDEFSKLNLSFHVPKKRSMRIVLYLGAGRTRRTRIYERSIMDTYKKRREYGKKS